MRGPKGRSPGRQDPHRPRRDWPVAALAAVGLVVAGYLTVTKLSAAPALFCAAGSGCDVVQTSRYAVFLGLPTAAWGAGLYAVVVGLALTGLSARRWLGAFLLGTAGAAFSAYLTYLSVFEVGATCGYCLASAGMAFALFGLLLARRPAAPGRRSPLRPGRLAALGAVTALATVIVGAGVFAWRGPGATVPYAEGLARHLTATGAVMYGAYW